MPDVVLGGSPPHQCAPWGSTAELADHLLRRGFAPRRCCDGSRLTVATHEVIEPGDTGRPPPGSPASP